MLGNQGNLYTSGSDQISIFVKIYDSWLWTPWQWVFLVFQCHSLICFPECGLWISIHVCWISVNPPIKFPSFFGSSPLETTSVPTQECRVASLSTLLQNLATLRIVVCVPSRTCHKNYQSNTWPTLLHSQKSKRNFIDLLSIFAVHTQIYSLHWWQLGSFQC